MTFFIPSFQGFIKPTFVTNGYLLDTISSNALMAYSLRKLRASYSGYICTLRRSSDNSEFDIAFNSSDVLGVDSICYQSDSPVDTILNVFYGTSGYLKVFYDQMMYANLIREGTTQQPILIINGVINTNTINNKPAIRTNANGNQIMTASFSQQNLTEMSLAIVQDLKAGSNSRCVMYQQGIYGGTNALTIVGGDSGNSVTRVMTAGGYRGYTTVFNIPYQLSVFASETALGIIRKDGNVVSSILQAAGAGNLYSDYILFGGTAGSYYDPYADYQEIIVFGTNASADFQTIEANQMNYYGIN